MIDTVDEIGRCGTRVRGGALLPGGLCCRRKRRMVAHGWHMQERSPNPASHMFLAAPPSPTEQRVAIGLIAFSVLTFALAAPFARVPLAVVPAFIPAYESALIIIDLITAVILFGQFQRQRSPAMLALAAGYLFDTFIIVPHALTFPGVFLERVFSARAPSRRRGCTSFGTAVSRWRSSPTPCSHVARVFRLKKLEWNRCERRPLPLLACS